MRIQRLRVLQPVVPGAGQGDRVGRGVELGDGGERPRRGHRGRVLGGRHVHPEIRNFASADGSLQFAVYGL